MPWTIFNVMPKKRTKLTSYWRHNIIICIICRNYSCWDYPRGWVVWLVLKGKGNCCEMIYSSTVLLKFKWFIYPLQPNQFSWGQTEQLGAHRQWHIGYRQRYQYLVELKSSFASKFWKSYRRDLGVHIMGLKIYEIILSISRLMISGLDVLVIYYVVYSTLYFIYLTICFSFIYHLHSNTWSHYTFNFADKKLRNSVTFSDEIDSQDELSINDIPWSKCRPTQWMPPPPNNVYLHSSTFRYAISIILQ